MKKNKHNKSNLLQKRTNVVKMHFYQCYKTMFVFVSLFSNYCLIAQIPFEYTATYEKQQKEYLKKNNQIRINVPKDTILKIYNQSDESIRTFLVSRIGLTGDTSYVKILLIGC